MTAAIIIFVVLIAGYAAIMWFTRQGGPADIVAFFDDEDSR